LENRTELYDIVDQIVDQDPRYRAEAYSFVMLAVNRTVASLKKQGHITGKELLSGIREYALDEFGPMAKTVFDHWGIHQTLDFGHIVFNLVGHGLLGKTDSDRLEDFAGGYDFEETFVRDYPWTGAPPAREEL
jgi:uncharacterized repeat protein (TIGR04138 family)